jgi:membrane associated rhomboid family serine protease
LSSIIDSETDSLQLTRQHLIESLRFPLVAVILLWLVHLWQVTEGFDPGAYGIMSRRAWGLRGIVTAPLIHGSWKHLISNTLPLFVLAFISLYFYWPKQVVIFTKFIIAFFDLNIIINKKCRQIGIVPMHIPFDNAVLFFMIV